MIRRRDTAIVHIQNAVGDGVGSVRGKYSCFLDLTGCKVHTGKASDVVTFQRTRIEGADVLPVDATGSNPPDASKPRAVEAAQHNVLIVDHRDLPNGRAVVREDQENEAVPVVTDKIDARKREIR